MQQRARLAGDSSPSFWDVSKWPEMWETGAKVLEQSAPGRIITAPIRLPEAALTATTKTVQQVPGIVQTVTKTIPIIAVGAVLLGGGFLYFKFLKGKKAASTDSLKIGHCH